MPLPASCAAVTFNDPPDPTDLKDESGAPSALRRPETINLFVTSNWIDPPPLAYASLPPLPNEVGAVNEPYVGWGFTQNIELFAQPDTPPWVPLHPDPP
jgi:hypothetical protein